jgi:chromosome segregation ATPase
VSDYDFYYHDIRQLQQDREYLQKQVWELERDLQRERTERGRLESRVDRLEARMDAGGAE